MSFRVKWKKSNKITSTKSTIFLLSVFGYRKHLYTDYLMDCYIKDIATNQLALVFHNADDEGLREQLYRLNNHHGFEESYTDDNDREIVIIMSIDKEFQQDFKRFLNGEYSKFSIKLKDLLMKDNEKATGVDENGKISHKVTVYDVLFPVKAKAEAIAKYLDVELKDVPRELWDKPNLDVESYKTIEQLKNEYSKSERL